MDPSVPWPPAAALPKHRAKIMPRGETELELMTAAPGPTTMEDALAARGSSQATPDPHTEAWQRRGETAEGLGTLTGPQSDSHPSTIPTPSQGRQSHIEEPR